MTNSYSEAMRFAVTIGFDAMRIATFRRPKHHNVETICQWLRYASRSSGQHPKDGVVFQDQEGGE